MRSVVAFCLVSGPMLGLGWPAPWLALCLGFAAGWLGRAPLVLGRSPRRGGYVTSLVSRNGRAGTVGRVETYTGFSTGGRKPGDADTRVTRAERSRPTGRGFSTDGRSDGSVMGGRRGGVAPEPLEPAGSEADMLARRWILRDAAHGLAGSAETLEVYRRRLTREQRYVLDTIADRVRETGVIPEVAQEWMREVGPWPDPWDGGDDGAAA